MKQCIIILFLLASINLRSQYYPIRGRVVDARSGEALTGASVSLEGIQREILTDHSGSFELPLVPSGAYVLLIELQDYRSKRLPVIQDVQPLNLGNIRMERELPLAAGETYISLSEAELGEETGLSQVYTLLHAGKDVFLNRAVFDFSQAFFRIRGYDSENTEVLLNGFQMNSLFDGRPQWNHWGGLNDVGKNQELSYGLRASETGYGGLLGNILIDTYASGLRPGYRFSGSLSNRTYRGRLMATYVSGKSDDKLEVAFSASRRWAREGYIPGTLYDAWSAFGSMEYSPDDQNSLSITALLASNRRGRSAPLTQEVVAIMGTSYNPYWGYQQGKSRNSRERLIREPILQFNYRYLGSSISLQTGIMYQFGIQSQSRLGYYDAPNPDPVYYRYLPSYSINNPGGANFLNADLAEGAFILRPQLDWDALYKANSGGKAAYLHYEDVASNKRLQGQALINLSLGTRLHLDAGLLYRRLDSDNFSRIRDLLGAVFHEDIDPFSATRNDVEGALKKNVGDRFGYSYRLNAMDARAFLQTSYTTGAWEAFIAGNYRKTNYRRTGDFLNERYHENSLGPGEELAFTTKSIKGGFQYHLGGRHWWSLYGTYGHRPPLLKYSYVNPRESNEQVRGLSTEQLGSLEFNYEVRLPELMGRLSAFYTRIMDKADIHFFFVDGGLGSDFVQEVSTGLDQLNMGLELGLEYDFTTSLKGSLVASLGKFVYASDPDVTINFDTAGSEDALINNQGNVYLGPAALKDLHRSTGPQKALSLGLEYRDPGYWWLGVTANYLDSNYLNPSVLKYTRSFLLDPATGQPFPNATPEHLAPVRAQHPLGSMYFLDLTAGKSWLRKGRYVSVFVSVSNLFDSAFKTGGYEQSRNGNYGQWVQDNLSGSPSFGPKYWYGYGRTFFLNLAVSF